MEGKVFTMDDAQALARHMAPIYGKLDELIELKAQILALKAYIDTASYVSTKALKQILGMEVTEDDD